MSPPDSPPLSRCPCCGRWTRRIRIPESAERLATALATQEQTSAPGATRRARVKSLLGLADDADPLITAVVAGARFLPGPFAQSAALVAAFFLTGRSA